MIDLIDVKEYKRKSKLRFIAHLVVVLLLTAGVIVGSVFSLIYSPLNYQLNLILNIVVDSLFFCFLIFYFFSIFPIVRHYYKLCRKMNPVAYEHRRDLTYVEERENRIVNNVKYRTLSFTYKEGETIYSENLYILDNDIELSVCVHYSIYTYQNIIIKLEELKHATI